MPDSAQDQHPACSISEERRGGFRIDASEMQVSLKIKGKLGRVQAQPMDFTQHGIALAVAKGTAKEKIVYLNLSLRHLSLSNLVGVIHNCCKLADGKFRWGIRFRPYSTFQFDQPEAESTLAEFENLMIQGEMPTP